MQQGFSQDIGHSSVLVKKTSGMERTFTSHKENGINMPILWLNTLKKVGTPYSEVSVRSTEESCRREEENPRFT